MKRSTIILGILAVVLLAGWYFLRTAEKSELSIRELHDLFAVDTARVDSIAFKYATWTHLTRRNGRWQVLNEDWSHPADTAMVRQVFSTTNDIVLENLISTRADKHEKLKIDIGSGALLQFFHQGTPLAQFVLGKRGPGASHTFIRRLKSDSVYQATGDLTQVFRRVPSDWMAKEMLSYDTAQIAEIRWTENGRETVLRRDDDRSWVVSLDDGDARPVDTSIANFKIAYVSRLRADALVPESAEIVAQLDNPAQQLVVVGADGRADTLQWNTIREEDVGRTYAFRSGHSKPIYIFFKGSYDRLFSRFSDLVRKDSTDSAL
ncbi:MAG TPA: DUF4340 domain-containing protein [candidate division Zixibacteria bacterium]|jgi:hypothetical protein